MFASDHRGKRHDLENFFSFFFFHEAMLKLHYVFPSLAVELPRTCITDRASVWEYFKYLYISRTKYLLQQQIYRLLPILACCSTTWLKLYAPFPQTTMLPRIPHSTMWKILRPSCQFIHAPHSLHSFPQICLTSFIHVGLSWPWPAIKLKFCGFKQCLAVQCLFVPVSWRKVNQKPRSKQCRSAV